MNMYNTDKFESKLASLNITLSEEQIDGFMRYYELLIEWNKVMNLTGITEFDEVIEKHFIDSLAIVKAVSMEKINSIIDVGTGAGFPGLPIAIAFPNVHVTLLDSLMKRVKFLNEVIAACGLKNVEAFQGRAEDFGKNQNYREKYDLAVSRAVANLSPLAEYCTPYVKVGGIFIAYKSGKAEEEIQNSEKAISVLGCEMKHIEKFNLDNGDGRTLVVIEKKNRTPKKYPRKAGTPTRNPL